MKKSTGFTLMELLVVIGVLAILAVGLLAAIDPLEQLKKARDTNARNAAVETLNSFQRYYATHGDYPWELTAPPTGCEQSATLFDDGNTVIIDAKDTGVGQDEEACITASLIADGELKARFYEGLQNPLYIQYNATTASVDVCFAPESKSQQNDATTKYIYTAGGKLSLDTDVCPPVAGGTDTCLQCFQ